MWRWLEKHIYVNVDTYINSTPQPIQPVSNIECWFSFHSFRFRAQNDSVCIFNSFQFSRIFRPNPSTCLPSLSLWLFRVHSSRLLQKKEDQNILKDLEWDDNAVILVDGGGGGGTDNEHNNNNTEMWWFRSTTFEYLWSHSLSESLIYRSCFSNQKRHDYILICLPLKFFFHPLTPASISRSLSLSPRAFYIYRSLSLPIHYYYCQCHCQLGNARALSMDPLFAKNNVGHSHTHAHTHRAQVILSALQSFRTNSIQCK